jgi:hypothetical protein
MAAGVGHVMVGVELSTTWLSAAEVLVVKAVPEAGIYVEVML